MMVLVVPVETGGDRGEEVRRHDDVHARDHAQQVRDGFGARGLDGLGLSLQVQVPVGIIAVVDIVSRDAEATICSWWTASTGPGQGSGQ